MLNARTAQERRLLKQLEAFQDRLSREVAPFADTSKRARERRFETCRLDTDEFGQNYAPHYFESESAAFHSDLDAMRTSSTRHVFVVHGPREHAKSSRLRVGLVQDIVYGRIRYYLLGSEHLYLARKHVEYLQVELAQNARLRTDFDIEVEKWEEGAGILRVRVTPHHTGISHTVQLEAISYGTSAKGRLYISRRPDGALIDDFENTRSSRNVRIAREKAQWVLQELYPAVTGPIVWVGNTGHDTSALYQAMLQVHGGDDDALRAFLSAGTLPGADIPAYPTSPASEALGKQSGETSDDAEPTPDPDAPRAEITAYSYRADTTLPGGAVAYLWPERYDPDWYATMRATMGHYYEGEMNGYPVKMGLYFKAAWFENRYDQLPEDVDLTWFSWCDPAFGKSAHACYKVIVAIASSATTHYVVWAWCRQQEDVRAMIDAWYDAFEEYPDLLRGKYENDFGQEDRLRRDISDAELAHGYPISVSGDSNRGGTKAARIESLQGLASRGRIRFPKAMTPDLKVLLEQLLGYPDAPYDDAPDALQSAIHRNRFSHRDRPKFETLGPPRRFVRTRR